MMEDGEAAKEEPAAAPVKPWKQRRSRGSSVVENEKPGEIEIFEGKVQSSRLPPAIRTTPVQAYTKVRTGDGFVYAVPTVVLKEAEQVKLMLNMDASFREKVENVVHFEDIRGEVLELVLRFCFEDLLNKARVEQLSGAGGPRPRLAFHFEVAPALAMEIISAAHFLGLKELLQLSSAMVAHNLFDVPDVSTLPKDLAWIVALHLSAEGLLEAEKREDFQAIGLDSPGLWKRHCLSRHWTGVASLGLSESSDRGEPPLFDAAAPDYWKRVYVTHDLHFASASVTSETFPGFYSRLQRWGNFAVFQLIGQSLYEELQPFFGQGALVRYASLFPELRWLVLDRIDFQQSRPGAKVATNRPAIPRDSSREDGRGEAPDLEALLQALPCLQVFVVKAPTWRHVDNDKLISDPVRGRSLGSIEIRALSHVLRVHQREGEEERQRGGRRKREREFGIELSETCRRLALLDWSTNPVEKEDFWEILRSLPHSSLKILDLSWCNIPSCSAPLDVLAGLQNSVLESLLLSGNPFGKPQWQQLDAVPVDEGSWRKVNGVWRKTMATPSARRPAKPSPGSKKSPTAGSGVVKQRGPVKRPEWNLCFLTEEVKLEAAEGSSPVDDEPGSSENRQGARQSTGADELGCAGGRGSTSQSPGTDEPCQVGQNQERELPQYTLDEGLGIWSRENREAGKSCAQEGNEFCSGRAEPGTSSSVALSPRENPVNREPSASGFDGMNGRRVVERPGGVRLGTVRAVSGPSSARVNAPVSVITSPGQAEPSVGGNAATGLAEAVTTGTDRKGKAKIDEEPPAVSTAPQRSPEPSNPPTSAVDVTHSDANPEGKPPPSIKGKEHVAEPDATPAAASQFEAPTVILGSLLTGLPPTLKMLVLSDCALSDVHVAQLVRGLTSAGCALEDLDLSQNEVSARGARAVFTWMQENRSLRQLSLAQNKVTSSCIDTLVAALRTHVALCKLSLAGNYSFGEERVPDVLEAAREHADLLAASDPGGLFSLDLSFIDVTHGARNRLRDVYGAYEHLELQI